MKIDAMIVSSLSTQVPIKSLFLNDGSSRKFHLGAMEVTLKHVSRRKIALADRPAGLALTALWYLGKEKVSPRMIARIRERLGEEEFEALRNEIDALPGWLDPLLSWPDSE